MGGAIFKHILWQVSFPNAIFRFLLFLMDLDDVGSETVLVLQSFTNCLQCPEKYSLGLNEQGISNIGIRSFPTLADRYL